MTERELLRLHLEAVWGISVPPLEREAVDLPTAGALPPWPMYQARLLSSGDEVTIWRADAAPALRADLARRARVVGVSFDPALGMRREVVLWLRSTGPAHTLSSPPAQPGPGARLLGAEDAALLETFEQGSAEYYLSPQRAPCMGVVVDGRLASVAHSSRRTTDACELGINTAPDARRRGYATMATLAWTETVRQAGLVPIYSAFADNAASLRLAAASGYTPVSEGVYGVMSDARG